jgi:hypothetical protein
LKDDIETPDIILVNAGSNDFDQEYVIANAVYRYSDLLKSICDKFPYSHIVASTLIGADLDGGQDIQNAVAFLFNIPLENDVIPELRDIYGCKISSVDMAGLVPSNQNYLTEFMDTRYLPTKYGYDSIGEKWTKKVKSIFLPNGSKDVPEVFSAVVTSENKLELTFTKPMIDSIENDVENFQISHGVAVYQATLDSFKRKVILSTSNLSSLENKDLTISVKNGLRDRNPVPDRKETLSSEPFYVTYNIGGDDVDDYGYGPEGPPQGPPEPDYSGENAKIPPTLTKILPIGDTLTVGTDKFPGGYRGLLYDTLTALGYNVSMLGTRSSSEPAQASDTDMDFYHEGWDGKSIDFFSGTAESFLDAIECPDVILLHVGMMDFVNDEDISNAIYRFVTLLREISDAQPHSNIIATNLMQHKEDTVDDHIQSYFNGMIQEQVDFMASSGVKVTFLDMRAGTNPVRVKTVNGGEITLTNQNSGFEKMSDAWVGAIQKVLTPHGDNSDPAVSHIRVNGHNEIEIVFSKPIANKSVNNLDRFQFDMGDITVESATLNEEKRKIALKTSDFSEYAGFPIGFTITRGIVDRTPDKRPLGQFEGTFLIPKDDIPFPPPLDPTPTASPSSSSGQSPTRPTKPTKPKPSKPSKTNESKKSTKNPGTHRSTKSPGTKGGKSSKGGKTSKGAKSSKAPKGNKSKKGGKSSKAPKSGKSSKHGKKQR